MIQSNNKDNKGNPYHDEEGKFTSGGNASSEVEETPEDKLAKMGFGETVTIRNKNNPDYTHVISKDRLQNVGDEWEVVEDKEEPKHDFTLSIEDSSDPQNEHEYEMTEEDVIGYIRDELEKLNGKFDNYDKDLVNWYSDSVSNLDDESFMKAFKESSHYSKIQKYFDDIIRENYWEDFLNKEAEKGEIAKERNEEDEFNRIWGK